MKTSTLARMLLNSVLWESSAGCFSLIIVSTGLSSPEIVISRADSKTRKKTLSMFEDYIFAKHLIRK